MSGQKGRLGRCFRCVYSWQIRRRKKPNTCPRCRSRLYGVAKLRPVVLGNGLGIDEVLLPHRDEILDLADQHGARNVRVFGSVRRKEAGPNSDVDLLVDWRRGSNRFRLEMALSALLHREVEVVSPDRLRWYAAPAILAEAVPL